MSNQIKNTNKLCWKCLHEKENQINIISIPPMGYGSYFDTYGIYEDYDDIEVHLCNDCLEKSIEYNPNLWDMEEVVIDEENNLVAYKYDDEMRFYIESLPEETQKFVFARTCCGDDEQYLDDFIKDLQDAYNYVVEEKTNDYNEHCYNECSSNECNEAIFDCTCNHNCSCSNLDTKKNKSSYMLIYDALNNIETQTYEIKEIVDSLCCFIEDFTSIVTDDSNDEDKISSFEHLYYEMHKGLHELQDNVNALHNDLF